LEPDERLALSSAQFDAQFPGFSSVGEKADHSTREGIRLLGEFVGTDATMVIMIRRAGIRMV
jgi:hypothetical protein